MVKKDTAALLESIRGRFPSVQIPDPSPVKGYPCIQLSSVGDLEPLMRYLKEEEGFNYLDFVTAVDWKGVVNLQGYIRDPNPNPFLPDGSVPQTLPRAMAGFPYRDMMDIVYAVSRWEEGIKLFVRIEVNREEPEVPSLTGIFKTADWQERETYDLLGVKFTGHPNLKKILTPDFIQGHPLRKDYVHVKDQYD